MPIISFTKEHVIPSSGVGSYLDFEIGAFNDVMTLCYNYDLSHTETDSTYDGDSLIVSDTVIVDSFDIADEYTVAGVKAGAFIEIWMSGVKWEDYGLIGEQYDYGSIPMMSGPAVWQDDVGTIIVKNTGNVSLQMRLINPYSEDYDPEPGVVVIDTLLNPGIEIDLSDKFICPLLIPNSGDDPTKGTMLFFGAEVNQPYLFTLLDVLCTTGILGMYSDPIQPY